MTQTVTPNVTQDEQGEEPEDQNTPPENQKQDEIDEETEDKSEKNVTPPEEEKTESENEDEVDDGEKPKKENEESESEFELSSDEDEDEEEEEEDEPLPTSREKWDLLTKMYTEDSKLTVAKFGTSYCKERKMQLQPLFATKNEKHKHNKNLPPYRIIKRFEGTNLSEFICNKVAYLQNINDSERAFEFEALYSNLKKTDKKIVTTSAKKRKNKQREKSRKKKCFDLSLLGFEK